MSAPDTKALPPAPVSTTTRISGSRAKSSRIATAASHMGSDIALCFSGLLKVSVPTRPSLRESTLSVWVMVGSLSDGLAVVQRLDLVAREAELGEHLVGMLAAARRRRGEPARRARER